MREYIRHIEEYLNYWQADFSKLIPANQWGNKVLAEDYLQKYWLQEEEYEKCWKPIQDKVFYQDRALPNLVYRPGFEMIALRGGCLFMEEDFMLFQNAVRKVGDNYFLIIQNSQEFTKGEPMFKMKFPINISWNELTSGNYISAVIFEMSYNEYFVFSESGKWGKYAANDYDYPLNIIGYKPEFASIFKELFSQSAEEQKEIREWLPREYRERIN